VVLRCCGEDVRLLSERKGNSAHTFAASIRKAVITPENDPTPPDEFERLEELQRQNKAIQEAWRNLLKSLGKIEPEQTDHTQPEKPKP